MSASANQLELVLALKGLQAVTAGLGTLRASFGSLNAFVAKFGLSLGAVMSAAGLANLAGQAVETAAEMNNLSEKVGMTTEQISGLAYSAKLADVAQEDLTKASRNLAQELRDTGRGSADIYEELLRLADQFAAMPDGATKTAIAMDKFKQAGVNMIPWLNQGSAAIREQIAEAERLGVVIGSDFAQDADELQNQFKRLKAAGEGLFLRLTAEILPAVLEQLDKFTTWVIEAESARTSIEGLVWVFQKLADAIRISAVYLGTMFSVIKERAEEARTSLLGKVKAMLSFITPFQLFAEATARFMKESGIDEARKPVPRERTEKPKTNDRALLSAEDLARERGALDVRIRENELITQKYLLAAQNRQLTSDEIASLRTQLDIAEQLVEQKRQLTADYLREDFITAEEARKTELEDKKALLEIEKERLEYQYDPNSIADQMEEATTKMLETWGTFAEQIGATFTDVINVGIDSIATNLTNVIMLTQSWSNALHNIGMSLMQEIIRAIIRMAAQWVVSHVIMKGAMMGLSALGDLLRAKDATKTISTEASKAPILAVNAANASTSSYGVASIVGLALAVAAIGAVVAAAMGAFKEGGYTGAGDPNAIAGVVHRGEFVMPANTVNRVGISALETIKKTGELPVAGGSNVSVEGHKVSVAVLDSRNQVREFLETAEGEAMIIDVARRRRTEIGINT